MFMGKLPGHRSLLHYTNCTYARTEWRSTLGQDYTSIIAGRFKSPIRRLTVVKRSFKRPVKVCLFLFRFSVGRLHLCFSAGPKQLPIFQCPAFDDKRDNVRLDMALPSVCTGKNWDLIKKIGFHFRT